MQIDNPIKKLSTTLLLFAALGSHHGILEWVRGHEPSWVELPAVTPPQWDSEIFKVLTFGHWPTAVDLLWVQAMIDPGIYHVPKGIHPPVFYHFDLATDLDPAFFEGYATGASIVNVIRDDAVGARRLLTKAERFEQEQLPAYPQHFKETFWKEQWLVPALIGYIEMWEFENAEVAGKAFARAAEFSNAPPFIRSLGKSVKTKHGRLAAALNVVEILLLRTEDKALREPLLERQEKLLKMRTLYSVNYAFSRYLIGKKINVPNDETLKRFWADMNIMPQWPGLQGFRLDQKVIRPVPDIETVMGLSYESEE